MNTLLFRKTQQTIPVLRNSVRCVLLFFLLAGIFPGVVTSTDLQLTDDYSREIRELAQTGDAEAQFALAMLLDLGTGPAKDREEAITWLEQAASQDLAAACYTLGLKYEFGVIVLKDSRQAAAWYRRAAMQDLPMAQYRLGMLHLPDDGSLPQPVPAFSWLSLAAEQGYPDAADARDRAAGLLKPQDRARAEKMLEDLRQQIGQRRKK